jgi:hypothetical protein
VAASAGRMLVAGGHLDRHPLTLIVGLVHCEITTTSGTDAMTAEENPQPGARRRERRDLHHLPAQPGPLAAVVSAAAAGHARLSSGTPPAEPQATASSAPLIDVAALRKEVTGP